MMFSQQITESVYIAGYSSSLIDRIMKRTKLWRIFLIVFSVAVLPFALVAVGQAQQMTCWCIKSIQTPRKSPSYDHPQNLDQNSENTEERIENGRDLTEDEGTKNISKSAS
jgi:hypothetical protein